jgi:DNA-binding CsgD family transcriptional regulator
MMQETTIKKLYEGGKTMAAIAGRADVAVSTVRATLLRLGVKIRPPGRRPPQPKRRKGAI